MKKRRNLKCKQCKQHANVNKLETSSKKKETSHTQTRALNEHQPIVIRGEVCPSAFGEQGGRQGHCPLALLPATL